MKRLKQLVLLLFLSMKCTLIVAQSDTIIIESTTEPIDSSDFKKKRSYQYLDNNFREEKNLLKLVFEPLRNFSLALNDPFYIELNGIFGFEKKIVPALSINIENNFRYHYHKIDDVDEWDLFYSNDIGIRYYYIINKRIKSKRGSNNFHSNYFSLEVENWIAAYYKKGFDHSGDNKFKKEWGLFPGFKFKWGIQRRFWESWVVDAGVYVMYSNNVSLYSYDKPFVLGLDLSFGLGWGK